VQNAKKSYSSYDNGRDSLIKILLINWCVWFAEFAACISYTCFRSCWGWPFEVLGLSCWEGELLSVNRARFHLYMEILSIRFNKFIWFRMSMLNGLWQIKGACWKSWQSSLRQSLH
jgi:hypothetical protein